MNIQKAWYWYVRPYERGTWTPWWPRTSTADSGRRGAPSSVRSPNSAPNSRLLRWRRRCPEPFQCPPDSPPRCRCRPPNTVACPPFPVPSVPRLRRPAPRPCASTRRLCSPSDAAEAPLSTPRFPPAVNTGHVFFFFCFHSIQFNLIQFENVEIETIDFCKELIQSDNEIKYQFIHWKSEKN